MDGLSDQEVFKRIVISLIAGILIGLEREWSDKPAGIRTYALVCEGSALFMIMSLLLAEQVQGQNGTYDPSRIASTVVQGIGFLAGGVIFTRGSHVRGLTTAAAVWVTAAVGLLIGAGYFLIAGMGVAASIFVLLPLRWLQREVIPSESRDARRGGNADKHHHNGEREAAATDESTPQ